MQTPQFKEPACLSFPVIIPFIKDITKLHTTHKGNGESPVTGTFGFAIQNYSKMKYSNI